MPKDEEGFYLNADDVTFNQTWADMEKVLHSGKVKAIGVSNFSVKKYVADMLPGSLAQLIVRDLA